MNGIGRVGNEIHTVIHLSVFFEGGFIINQGDHDFSIFWDIRLSYEDKISIFHSFFIHRVSFSSEEEVFITRGEEFVRYGNLRFDIFFREYRHPTGDSPDERYCSYFVAIGRVLRRDFYLISCISVEPTFFHDLIEED